MASDLPVVFDYRSVKKEFPEDLDRRLEGHRWAITNLLPRVSKSGAVSRARLYNSDAHDTIVDIDQAVKNRWFVYDPRPHRPSAMTLGPGRTLRTNSCLTRF